jgi:hypothetical protein
MNMQTNHLMWEYPVLLYRRNGSSSSSLLSRLSHHRQQMLIGTWDLNEGYAARQHIDLT